MTWYENAFFRLFKLTRLLQNFTLNQLYFEFKSIASEMHYMALLKTFHLLLSRNCKVRFCKNVHQNIIFKLNGW